MGIGRRMKGIANKKKKDNNNNNSKKKKELYVESAAKDPAKVYEKVINKANRLLLDVKTHRFAATLIYNRAEQIVAGSESAAAAAETMYSLVNRINNDAFTEHPKDELVERIENMTGVRYEPPQPKEKPGPEDIIEVKPKDLPEAADNTGGIVSNGNVTEAAEDDTIDAVARPKYEAPKINVIRSKEDVERLMYSTAEVLRKNGFKQDKKDDSIHRWKGENGFPITIGVDYAGAYMELRAATLKKQGRKLSREHNQDEAYFTRIEKDLRDSMVDVFFEARRKRRGNDDSLDRELNDMAQRLGGIREKREDARRAASPFDMFSQDIIYFFKQEFNMIGYETIDKYKDRKKLKDDPEEGREDVWFRFRVVEEPEKIAEKLKEFMEKLDEIKQCFNPRRIGGMNYRQSMRKIKEYRSILGLQHGI